MNDEQPEKAKKGFGLLNAWTLILCLAAVAFGFISTAASAYGKSPAEEEMIRYAVFAVGGAGGLLLVNLSKAARPLATLIVATVCCAGSCFLGLMVAAPRVAGRENETAAVATLRTIRADPTLASVTKQGYVFEQRTSASDPARWFATARPQTVNETGERYFCTNHEGAIFWTTSAPFPLNTTDCSIPSGAQQITR